MLPRPERGLVRLPHFFRHALRGGTGEEGTTPTHTSPFGIGLPASALSSMPTEMVKIGISTEEVGRVDGLLGTKLFEISAKCSLHELWAT